MLFKVLGADGKPLHGGTGDWPLPTVNRAGRWLQVAGNLACCVNGLHLTSDPLRWWRQRARVFVAEAKPLELHGDYSDKAAFRRVRLLYEVTADWPLLVMFPRIRAFLAASGNLSGANLSDADLRGADLSGANLSDADLSGANLSDAYLSDANLSDANLSGADLSGANLSGANLSDANLSDANLSGADLSGANLSDANLSGADLSDANLSGADLSGANLSDANLSGANLSGANLSGAYLSGADLSGANLSGAYRPTDVPDGWTVTASGVLVRNEEKEETDAPHC